jgi:hypothetical protein
MAMGAFAWISSMAQAQNAAPPKLEPIEEPIAGSAIPADEAEVTVARRAGDRIEEFRYRGRLYMIKVYPAVGLPYMLVDDRGDGVFNRKDARGQPIKPAQWNILSW